MSVFEEEESDGREGLTGSQKREREYSQEWGVRSEEDSEKSKMGGTGGTGVQYCAVLYVWLDV